MSGKVITNDAVHNLLRIKRSFLKVAFGFMSLFSSVYLPGDSE